MSDFCLSPHALAGITSQADLMDRMALRAGIGPSSTARSADPALWYEARLKCMGCAMSERCMRFLQSPCQPGRRMSRAFAPTAPFLAI